MHPKNLHQERYDLEQLAKSSPELKLYIMRNKYGDESVDFTNPMAVKALNRALLKKFYGIDYWDIPSDFLCPPIPGRADYIHSAADLFSKPNGLRVLDIGTGANCIYPLLGFKIYQWEVVGSELSKPALENAKKIVTENKLSREIELRHQDSSEHIFKGIIQPTDKFDLTLCNPPFHESLNEALAGTQRKWKNLGKSTKKTQLNFGGTSHELWCPGGEKAFILTMIQESIHYKKQVKWFTTLVSKETTLPSLKKALSKLTEITEVRTIDMNQGQKKSRLLAWTFN